MNHNYINFLCHCGEKFVNFSTFKNHASSQHKCANLSLQNLVESWRGETIKQKFYWGFICLTSKCKRRKFTSGAITAIVKVNRGKNPSLTVERKYPLACLKCQKTAQFENQELLDQYLLERSQQRLIYARYENNFPKIERKERELEGHIQELCSRCQELGQLCLQEHQQQKLIWFSY